MIPLSVPSITGNEWKYVKECLDTGWISSAGKFVNQFEEEIAKYTGAKHAIACVNGTSSLQIALQIAGVEGGDEVIVPTISFIAPINAVKYNGANPVFMDADSFYNIDTDKTIEFIKKETKYKYGHTYNIKTDKRISAIILVHVFGNAVEIEKISKLCKERNIKVIEDAAESIGTRYKEIKFKGKHTGTIGELGCISFNGNKIITSGGGGMIITDDVVLAEKVKYLTTQAKDDNIRYIHDEIGYNFRLTNIQSAIGVAQLELLPKYLEIKKKIYQEYKEYINEIPGVLIAEVPEYANNNHWMVSLQIDKNIYGKNREELMAIFSDKNIETRPVWQLNHLQKPYKNCQSYKIEKAPELLAKTLNIPSSVNISPDQVRIIMEVLKNA